MQKRPTTSTPLANAEVKNVCSYASAPTLCLHEVEK
jgi:hypothetical protein